MLECGAIIDFLSIILYEKAYFFDRDKSSAVILASDPLASERRTR